MATIFSNIDDAQAGLEASLFQVKIDHYFRLPQQQRAAYLRSFKEKEPHVYEAILLDIHSRIEAKISEEHPDPSDRTAAMRAIPTSTTPSTKAAVPVKDSDLKPAHNADGRFTLANDGSHDAVLPVPLVLAAKGTDDDDEEDVGLDNAPAPKRLRLSCTTASGSACSSTATASGPSPAQRKKIKGLGASATSSYAGPRAALSQNTWAEKARVEAEAAKRELADMRQEYNTTSEKASEAAEEAEQADLKLKSLKRKHAQKLAEAETLRQQCVHQEGVVEACKVKYNEFYLHTGHLASRLTETRENCTKLVRKEEEARSPYAGSKLLSEVRVDVGTTHLSQVAFDSKTVMIERFDYLKQRGFPKNREHTAKCQDVKAFLTAIKHNPNSPVPVPDTLAEWLSYGGFEGKHKMGDFQHWGRPLYKTFTTLRAFKVRSEPRPN